MAKEKKVKAKDFKRVGSDINISRVANLDFLENLVAKRNVRLTVIYVLIVIFLSSIVGSFVARGAAETVIKENKTDTLKQQLTLIRAQSAAELFMNAETNSTVVVSEAKRNFPVPEKTTLVNISPISANLEDKTFWMVYLNKYAVRSQTKEAGKEASSITFSQYIRLKVYSDGVSPAVILSPDMPIQYTPEVPVFKEHPIIPKSEKKLDTTLTNKLLSNLKSGFESTQPDALKNVTLTGEFELPPSEYKFVDARLAVLEAGANEMYFSATATRKDTNLDVTFYYHAELINNQINRVKLI